MTLSTPRPRSHGAIAVLTVILLWTQPLTARGRTTTLQDPSTAALELEILELKSAGRYRDCSERVARLLTQLTAESNPSPESAARVEFLLELQANLALKIPDHAGVVTSVDALAASPALRGMPLLASVADRIAAENLMSTGRCADASKRMDRLGYVRNFAILGPLDNERGSGFRRRFAPELAPTKGIDWKMPVDGKKRPVTWREVSVLVVPLAHVDFGARLRPVNQSLVYAAFAVSSDVERDLCLRLGSTGSTAVFVDGREVLRHEVEARPLGFDQDVCSFRAARGRSVVLIKVCAQEGELALRARLTTVDGKPIDAATLTSGRIDDLRAAFENMVEATAEPAPALESPIEVITDRVAELAKADPAPNSAAANEVAMLAFRVAFVLALRSQDDETKRRDRDFAAIATKYQPAFGAGHYLNAFTLIRRGASNPDRDENARRRALEAAIAAWPRHAEAMRALADLENETLERQQIAHDWLQRALAIHPQYAQACLDRLELLESIGFDAVRLRFLGDCMAVPELAQHPDVLGVAALDAQTRSDLAEERSLLERKLARRYDVETLVVLADLLAKLGEDEAAKARLDEARRNFVQLRSVHEALARHHEVRNEVDEALRVWSRWLELCPEDAAAIVETARLHQRSGAAELEAMALSSAIELDPTLKNERRRLDWLEAGKKSFYDGLTIDGDAVRNADKGPDPDATEAGDTHYYAIRHTILKAYRNGTTSRYDHILAKVLREDAANIFDTYRAPSGGGQSNVRILEARVIHEDGSFERAQLGNTRYADLPPIRVGDWVEVKSRVDDRERTFFGDYFGYTHLFPASEPVPVRVSRLDLLLEGGRDYTFQTVGEVGEASVRELEDGTKHHAFEVKDLPRRRAERFAPSILECGPLVRVSTYADWNAFASWWWNLIRKQTQLTPEIKAKVAELVDGKATIEQKVRAIYDFVVSDIRYNAWEFGVHGYKPYSVGSIFERRFGDCKDKSILMNAMLSEIGVEAFPVLIKADVGRDVDDLTLPMVQHFNHCISYVPAQQGMPARFLDGTAQYHAIETLPAMDRGAKVVVVKGGRAELLDIPWSAPSDEQETTSYVITLDADGAATIDYRYEPRGNAATTIREDYGSETARRDVKLQDRLAARFGRVELESSRYSDLASLETPVDVRARFLVKDLAARDGPNAFRLPVTFDKTNLGTLTPSEQRSYDLVLSNPSAEHVTIDYVAPEGWRFARIPENVDLDTKVGDARLRFVVDGQRLRIERHIVFENARIRREDYSVFKDFTEAVDRIGTLDLRMEKKQ